MVELIEAEIAAVALLDEEVVSVPNEEAEIEFDDESVEVAESDTVPLIEAVIDVVIVTDCEGETVAVTLAVAVVMLAVADTVPESPADEDGVVDTLTVGDVDTLVEAEDESENDPLAEMVCVEEPDILDECMPLELPNAVEDIKTEGEMPEVPLVVKDAVTQADALGLDDAIETDELGDAVTFVEALLDGDTAPVIDVSAVTLTIGLAVDTATLGDTATEWLAASVAESVKVGDAVDEAVRGVGAGSDTLGVMVDVILELTVVDTDVEVVGAELGVYAVLAFDAVDEGVAAETVAAADAVVDGLPVMDRVPDAVVVALCDVVTTNEGDVISDTEAKTEYVLLDVDV